MFGRDKILARIHKEISPETDNQQICFNIQSYCEKIGVWSFQELSPVGCTVDSQGCLQTKNEQEWWEFKLAVCYPTITTCVACNHISTSSKPRVHREKRIQINFRNWRKWQQGEVATKQTREAKSVFILSLTRV